MCEYSGPPCTQVPLNVLRMFTWNQAELLVTGRNEVDLRLLREMTVYESPFTESHPTMRLFWEMMEDFTPAERWVAFVHPAPPLNHPP